PQGGFAVEALLAGIAGDLSAVQGDALQVDESLGPQGGDMADEQAVQLLVMVGVEVGQGVVVGGVAAAEPLEGEALGAVAVQVTGAADAVEAGVQPEGAEDVGAEGRLAGVALDSLDAGMEGGEVELLDQVPHGTGLVVVGELLVEGGVRAAVAVHRPVARCGSREFHQKSSPS